MDGSLSTTTTPMVRSLMLASLPGPSRDRGRTLTTVEGDELRMLEGNNLDTAIPPWLDQRRWVRWPAIIVHHGHIVFDALSSPRKLLILLNQVNTLSLGTIVLLLLIFPTLAIIGGILGWGARLVFALNFIALVPLEYLLNAITEELCLSFGQLAETVLVIALPHIFPLILGITAVSYGDIRLAQSFITGSIISNLFIGLGGCFISAGIHQSESHFNAKATNTESKLLFVVGTILTIFKMLSSCIPQYESQTIFLIFSQSAAIILLVLCFLYLSFKLRTHVRLWAEENESDGGIENTAGQYQQIRPVYAIALVAVLILTVFCARYLIRNVHGLVGASEITVTFTGLVLLPIITNVSNYIRTYGIAYNNDMDLAISLTLSASVDIAFFTLPILVLMGWFIGQPMSMDFPLMETMILDLSLFTMARLVEGGKSNWFSGSLCIGLYIIIALAYLLCPDDLTGW